MTLLHRLASIRSYRGLQPFSFGVWCHSLHLRHYAISILKRTVYKDLEFPEIESVIEDVDISALDQKHVIPNMEPPVWRGVWFPSGFAGLMKITRQNVVNGFEDNGDTIQAGASGEA